MNINGSRHPDQYRRKCVQNQWKFKSQETRMWSFSDNFHYQTTSLSAKYKREAGISVKIRFFYPLGNAVVITIIFHSYCVSVEPIQEEFPSNITLLFCVSVCDIYRFDYLFRWIYTSQSSLCEFSVNMLGNYLTLVKEKQINQYCANILQGKVKIFS